MGSITKFHDLIHRSQSPVIPNISKQIATSESKTTTELLKEIGLLHRQNLEMIQTIVKSGSGEDSRPKYKNFFDRESPRDLPPRSMHEIRFSNEGLFVTETGMNKTRFNSVRIQWAVNYRLIEIPDRFKENIDYRCSSFSDITRLNEHMNKLAQQYSVFGDNPTSRMDLEQIRQNLSILQTQLRKIYQFYQKTDEQIQQEVQAELNHINQQLSQLVARYPSVTFIQSG